MYRNICFRKLKKLIEELKASILINYSGDSNLALQVLALSDALDENTQKDEILTERVDNLSEISGDIDITPVSTQAIDNLFND